MCIRDSISGMFLTISLLLSVLTRVWLIAKEHKNKYKILARTDSLTNIYNRYGFDELAEKIISKNPQTHFVAALLDIDDFKDVYKRQVLLQLPQKTSMLQLLT